MQKLYSLEHWFSLKCVYVKNNFFLLILWITWMSIIYDNILNEINARNYCRKLLAF